ncbi:hypothetical protein [Costertonia aggregata]|uniref:Uncharacterized protein n=1 Tax=Costertonia aggregata TaxID=343403 RepID=A0A7H9AM18_9FLAO|nr:hypothetical protein [Costertonia aggregata]QLG44500.1 hypothetical protein HYG79_03775 [Costertonia aggregata]
MIKYYLLLFILMILFSCKNKTQIIKDIPKRAIEVSDSASQKKDYNLKKVLTKTNNFENILKVLKYTKHTGSKHFDELTNSSSNFISHIFSLHEKELSVKTTSYTYKDECVFYLHNIKCVADSLSIKPFLESAQGKPTKGYLGEPILIFAMKNDREANYIDIPEKMNPLALREELLETLYEKIDSDIILCDRAKDCEYKDLRKAK